MKLELAREIVTYCYILDYKRMLYRYYKTEIMQAIRTIESRKSSTSEDKQYADIVYWKIAFRPIKQKG